MSRLALAVLLCATGGRAANISDDFLGTWTPVNHSTAHTPLGPAGLWKQFAMTKDRSNGDHWFSAIKGQVFRVRGDLMEYCFAHVAESPFVVHSVQEHKLVFCYKTGERMRTHKTTASGLATGCDAAQITLEILSSGNLEFTFLMSPPVKHAWFVFERTGESPPVAKYIRDNRGNACDPKHPGPPTLATGQSSAALLSSSMCPAVVHKKKAALQTETTEKENAVYCRQLDGFSKHVTEKVDIRFQYTTPKAPCWPCSVSYSVSAAIEEDQYIAVGFKGMAYRYYEDVEVTHPVRPNYFGMSTDDLDEERTSRVIVLGYAQAGSGCVREMKAEDYVGAVTDVAGNPHLYDESAERTNGRTVVRFTVEQHVGNTTAQIETFFGTAIKAELVLQSARVMYAIGEVGTAIGEDACKMQVQYHNAYRGVSPLSWFSQNPKCKAENMELTVVV